VGSTGGEVGSAFALDIVIGTHDRSLRANFQRASSGKYRGITEQTQAGAIGKGRSAQSARKDQSIDGGVGCTFLRLLLEIHRLVEFLGKLLALPARHLLELATVLSHGLGVGVQVTIGLIASPVP